MSAPPQAQPQTQHSEANHVVKSEHEATTVAPTSEFHALRLQVDQNPFNTAAWNALIDKAEESGDLDTIKDAYEALLERYPNTSAAQIAYINHFLTNPATFPFAESLFARFLRTSPSVDLWKFYVVYVRRVNSGPATRDTVRKAYEFALSHVGQDKDSGDIWSEYIHFLKSAETSTTWEEQQKMDALRKVYHRAVQIPLENVEGLWKEYEAFENALNKITAKKFMADLSPAYMTARLKLRDLRKHLAALFPPPPPASSPSGRAPLQLPHKPTYSPADRALAGAWKQYLKWEEANPLEIEDKQAFAARMQGVYRKAVIRMRFFGEIWFMAYTWTSGVGKQDEATGILKAGIEANPTSFVLNFAHAETLELQKNNEAVHTLYEKLLHALADELETIEARLASPTSTDAPAAPPTPVIENGMAPPDSANGIQRDEKEKEKPAPGKSKELADRRQEYSLVYIMYIRFALRAEGVEASRTTFGKARKDKWSTWEVFEAAAFMEYHVSKQLVVANKILSLAYGKFSDEIEFVVRYLTFLLSVNDENNARALFERAVVNFPPDKARPLWERWARFEYQYGNLEAAIKLEKRMSEAYPNDPPIKRFAQRHSYLNIDGIANRDLGFSVTRQNAIARTDTLLAIGPNSPTSGSGSGSGSGNSGGNPSLAVIASSSKRAQSPVPDRTPRREDMKPGDHGYGGPPHKRTRDLSPGPRDRDRERWAGPKGRYGSPGWERERERERSPPRRPPREREEPEKPVVPQVLSWFVSQMPPPNTFDGPVFRTDDLMQLLRNAVIPSNSAARARSPPPPPRAARPPPDYGPYQGPSGPGGRGGRRY